MRLTFSNTGEGDAHACRDGHIHHNTRNCRGSRKNDKENDAGESQTDDVDAAKSSAAGFDESVFRIVDKAGC